MTSAADADVSEEIDGSEGGAAARGVISRSIRALGEDISRLASFLRRFGVGVLFGAIKNVLGTINGDFPSSQGK